MKWFIIILVMASLLSSVMWVMPSPRQRHQGRLRLKARQLGIQVQLVRVSFPRATGEIEGEDRTLAAYRFARTNLDRDERSGWRCWEVLRVETLNNTGLPEHWSWGKEVAALQPAEYKQLSAVLQQLPQGVQGVESTPLNLTLYWNERGDEAMLDRLAVLIRPLLDAKI
jgi:hypothetical protein